jgi:hypothetical protein
VVLRVSMVMCLLYTCHVCCVTGAEIEEVYGVKSERSGDLTNEEASMLSRHPFLSLNIGGIVPDESWVNVNAQVWSVIF